MHKNIPGYFDRFLFKSNVIRYIITKTYYCLKSLGCYLLLFTVMPELLFVVCLKHLGLNFDRLVQLFVETFALGLTLFNKKKLITFLLYNII